MKTASGLLYSHKVVNIYDLRRLAQARLPKVVFDYLDGGAEGEITLRENSRIFDDVIFHPHYAVNVAPCNLRTSVLGLDLSMPLVLAPVGYSRLMHPDGEVAAAAAAGDAGIPYTLSTVSGHKLENVKAASKGPVWYQLYLLGGQPAAEGSIERARVAGFSALVVTIDTPVAGMRERDPRNGMKQMLSSSIFDKFPFLPNLLAHPSWVASFLLDGGVPPLQNVVIPGKGPLPLTDVTTALSEAVVTWDSLKWIRKIWNGPIIVKGLLTPDDARRAVDEGASAIVVSNHGGRQLDCVSATLRALPGIVAAINGQVEILMDSGVRRGADVVKALALGARAVLVGRAYAYGLAVAGQPGVARAIEILRADIERTLLLLGCKSVTELNHSYVGFPAEWLNPRS